MLEITNKQIVEALIMTSTTPLSVERIHKIFIDKNNLLEISTLREIIKDLSNDYADRGVELKEVANGWRFQSKASLNSWISKLYEEHPPRYSKALMEILALIAYRQPITKVEIEKVRGIGVNSNIIKTLLEYEWIKIIGHKDVPGRPVLFITTKKFLDHFNLKCLDELPSLAEFTEDLSR
ncbi:MAG: SMC-Scp complex subunit ScpB [Coxiellaceae bacterium]|jgi:segregation and condensation protein B|nr:SMC-Scp complex subunit ScpB [Coxiellaceae bacterium]